MIRSTLKRSRWLHSLVKLGKRFPEVPLSDWSDTRRTAAIFRVLPNTMLSAPRLINAYEAMQSVEREGLRGDVAECGVWAGGAIGLMASVSKRYGDRNRRFHLFDSFEGLPQPSEHDLEVFASFVREHGHLADGRDPDKLVAIDACVAPLEEALDLFFGVLKIDPRQVVVHKGWFQDTVPCAAVDIESLAILRLDGDWYESTKVCLEHLFDKVVPGGFVIIDDYGFHSGCRKATDEFLTERGVRTRLVAIDDEGAYFRKDDSPVLAV